MYIPLDITKKHAKTNSQTLEIPRNRISLKTKHIQQFLLTFLRPLSTPETSDRVPRGTICSTAVANSIRG
jgi:hypothetical protein